MFKGIISAAALFILLASPLCLRGQDMQTSKTVEIGLLSTTHVLFTSDLTYVDISMPDVVLARIVDQSKNLLALKARCEFDFVTTVSALEANGTMHTFYVRFNASPKVLVIDTRPGALDPDGMRTNTQIRPGTEVSAPAPSVPQPDNGSGKKDRSSKLRSGGGQAAADQAGNGISVTGSQTSNFGRGNAPTIEEVMQKPAGLYHIVDKCYGLEVSCENVYAYSDLTYFVINIRNTSDIGYLAGVTQFTVESRKSAKNVLSTDKSVIIRSQYGTLSCAPRSESKIGFTVPKITLQKSEILKIYIYEKGGSRNMFLTLDPNDINYAVSPL